MTKIQNSKIGGVLAVSISEKKGMKKKNVDSVKLKEGFGIVGDAHAGSPRQLSLLAEESIEKIRLKGLKVGPGDFAENITTEGMDLLGLRIGNRLCIGNEAVIEITAKGKECHTRCSIYYRTGDCVMPREGIFAKIVKGGVIKPGDRIIVLTRLDLAVT